jgi:hypothetical protein
VDAEENEGDAGDNGAAADEGNWNPVEWDRAVEELTPWIGWFACVSGTRVLGCLVKYALHLGVCNLSIQHWTFCRGGVQFERTCCCISLWRSCHYFMWILCHWPLSCPAAWIGFSPWFKTTQENLWTLLCSGEGKII